MSLFNPISITNSSNTNSIIVQCVALPLIHYMIGNQIPNGTKRKHTFSSYIENNNNNKVFKVLIS